MNINGIVKGVGDALTRNAPSILTGMGAAGVISTAIFAVRATPKALEIKRQINRKLDEEWYNDASADPIRKRDYIRPYIRQLGPVYLPAIISGAASIACIIGANAMHLRREGMLFAAYELSQHAFDTWKRKAADQLGDKKLLDLRESIAGDKLERAPETNPPNVIITAYGDTRCYDAVSGRYFMSDIEQVRQAENRIIKRLAEGESCRLNDFYDELGLPDIAIGEIMGWDHPYEHPEIFIGSHVDADGQPCLVLEYDVKVISSRFVHS